MVKNRPKYFCDLESIHYNSKVMNVLEHENGEIITKQKDILTETGKYYKDLYSSKEHNLNDVANYCICRTLIFRS